MKSWDWKKENGFLDSFVNMSNCKTYLFWSSFFCPFGSSHVQKFVDWTYGLLNLATFSCFGSINIAKIRDFDIWSSNLAKIFTFRLHLGGKNFVKTPIFTFSLHLGGKNFVKTPIFTFRLHLGGKNFVKTPIFIFRLHLWWLKFRETSIFVISRIWKVKNFREFS